MTYPSLYQINARVWVNQLSTRLGKIATLDEISEEEIARLAHLGFDWVYLLGVWQTGEIGEQRARQSAGLQKEVRATLPDLSERDICSSCFAITGYQVHTELGGETALAALRQRLKRHGLRLMLDFIPNHTAIDHPWAWEHPDYYVPGTPADLALEPRGHIQLETADGARILAHGRDPHFPAWHDTLQINYGNPAVQRAMLGELHRAAEHCDGLRCDMVMLILPEVFQRTWGIAMQPFWPAAVQEIHQTYPGFIFMAEVYWNLEWTLQQQGFDYTYDKRLYDRLQERHARPVREHLNAGLDFQNHLARFLENHDEPRAAAAFPPDIHRAAAVITYFLPGLRFFHQGQLEGLRKRIPMQLCRDPQEDDDPALVAFYRRLLECLDQPALRQGTWQPVEPQPAWGENQTGENFISFTWHCSDGIDAQATRRVLVVVNYSAYQSQCLLKLPFADLRGRAWRLVDCMNDTVYERRGDDLAVAGLYCDLPAWGYHLFEIN
jgi:hypothetical protein